MSQNSGKQSQAPKLWIKLVISAIILFHLSAIISHVLSGGGPFVMRQASAFYRPYLKTMWLDNAYRFYAPDPGPTEVLWYHLRYDDGSTRWTQVPDRDQFYLRMPFQRHMSIALLASMMTEQEVVNPKDDPASAASILVNNRPTMRTVLTPSGEIYYRSYARHIGRVHGKHPQTGASLVSMDCYMVQYIPRTPYHMRMAIDMYDPRMIRIQSVATFSPSGTMSNHSLGFKDRIPDDFFIELMQNEIVPLLEANANLPQGEQRSLMQVLKDYGIPYPLIQPIAKLVPEEQTQFFKKPLDRDSLRERYAKIIKRDDKDINKPVIADWPENKPSAPEKKTSDTAIDKAGSLK